MPLLELKFPLIALGQMVFLFSPLKSAPTPSLELRSAYEGRQPELPCSPEASSHSLGEISWSVLEWDFTESLQRPGEVGVCFGKKFKLKDVIVDRSLPLLHPSSFPCPENCCYNLSVRNECNAMSKRKPPPNVRKDDYWKHIIIFTQIDIVHVVFDRTKAKDITFYS